jgi:hypothetical protein
VKTYTDMLGRSYKTVYPDSAYSQSFYNNQGELWKQRDPDGVITLSTNINYNESYSVVDMDQDSQIDWGGPDRISKTVTDLTDSGVLGEAARRNRSFVYANDGSASELLVSTSEAAVDGSRHVSHGFGGTNWSETAYATGNNRYVTNTAPDGSLTVSHYLKGILQSSTRKMGTIQLSQTTYGYDQHGRVQTQTDARNGTTTFAFNDAGQVISVTTPDPDGAGPGQPQVTSTDYDNMGRVWRTVMPDNSSVTNEYHLTGERRLVKGSRVYPTGYGYDAQGRLTSMTNWSGFDTGTGARVTRWIHHPQRGWLSSKRYPDDKGPDYTYTPAGQLDTRTWARTVGGQPLVTDYVLRTFLTS